MNFHEGENYLHYLTTNVYVVLQAAADITDLDKRLSQVEINGIEYDKQDNF